MYVNPRPGDLRSEQMEGTTEYLTRMRRMLFLRGPIMGVPHRWDAFSPVVAMDSIVAINAEDDDAGIIDHDARRSIYLVVDSPGGDVDAGLMLYDTIKMSQTPVVTVGQNCASMATVVLAAGHRRLLYPHATAMLHLPSGGAQGDAKDVEIRSRWMQRVKDSLVKAYQDSGVGKTKRQILKDIDREHWMMANEVVEYGLADGIITPEEMMASGI